MAKVTRVCKGPPHDGDVLPFRCEYETTSGAKQTNVGVNYIQSAVDGWWSFADVCKSKILTGRCPEILETTEFIPIGRQTTNVVRLFGNQKYTIDLTKDDLFTKVIEMRTTVKNERDNHPKTSADYARLDAVQLALKLLANATSYGVLIEVVVDERAAQVPCMIYHGPALAEEVKQGKTKLSTAAKIVAKKSSPRPPGSGTKKRGGEEAKRHDDRMKSARYKLEAFIRNYSDMAEWKEVIEAIKTQLGAKHV